MTIKVTDMTTPDQAMTAAKGHIYQAEQSAERMNQFEANRAVAHAGIAVAYMELADRLGWSGSRK